MLEARALRLAHGRRTLAGGLSLRVSPGEVVGLFGPSGCGKTTLGRVLSGLSPPAGGDVLVDGRRIHAARRVQYLHQSPLLAMNPRWRVGRVIAEPGPVDPGIAELIGVSADWADRFPDELSGGQLQRVSILRALGARPGYLIADEITSALDPVAQARIWHVLGELAHRCRIGILAISHDRDLLDRIARRSVAFPA